MDLEPIGFADQVSGRVQLHRRVAAAQPPVWQALTSAAGLSTWLGRLQGPALGPGVAFGLWHEEQVRSDHVVLDWLPLHRPALTWQIPGEELSHLRVTLEGDGAGSVLVVEHEGLTDPVAYAAGWHVHLDFLAESVLGSPRSFETFWGEYETVQRIYSRPNPWPHRSSAR